MIDKENNTSVYCKFSNSAYLYMVKYSKFIGSSVADFIRQAVAERIIRLGETPNLPLRRKNNMFDKTKKSTENGVYEIRDLVQDEPVIPQFCSKTEENAKRQFAIFLSQNKFKPSDFRLNRIGYYNNASGEMICNGSQVLLADYMRDDFEATEQPKE